MPREQGRPQPQTLDLDAFTDKTAELTLIAALIDEGTDALEAYQEARVTPSLFWTYRAVYKAAVELVELHPTDLDARQHQLTRRVAEVPLVNDASAWLTNFDAAHTYIPLWQTHLNKLERLADARQLAKDHHNLAAYLREYAHTLHSPEASSQAVEDARTRMLAQAEELRTRAMHLDRTGAPSLAQQWRFLGDIEPNWLTTNPPPLKPLLRKLPKPSSLFNTNKGPIVLPRGIVAMLIGAGSFGKTTALSQLAVSVATGMPWLGYEVDPSATGAVLMMLGEDDVPSIWRRINRLGLLLTDDQREKLRERLMPISLRGHQARFIEYDPITRKTSRTRQLYQLREYLDGTGVDWSLVIIEPASRFLPADGEKDNAAATDFITALEFLTEARGNPTVLIGHHMHKAAIGQVAEAKTAKELAFKISQAASRGASALTDGVRWQANLLSLKDAESRGKGVFSIVKTNYGPMDWCPIKLNTRDAERFGDRFVPTIELDEDDKLENGL